MSHPYQINPRASFQTATNFLRPLFEARDESKRRPSTIILIDINEARRKPELAKLVLQWHVA